MPPEISPVKTDLRNDYEKAEHSGDDIAGKNVKLIARESTTDKRISATTVGSKVALDVSVAEGINVEVDLDKADDSVAIWSNTAKDGTGTAYQPLLDDDGHAQVDVVTNTDSVDGPGAPTIDSYTTADVNLAAGTANQSVVSAPGASKQIWVYGLTGTADVAGSISIQDEDDTALSGVMPVAATGGFVMNPSGNFAMPWIKVATNKALEIDTVTCSFDGIITYAIVSV